MSRAISVVIATRDRAQKLDAFFARLDLAELAEVDAEVIVVDNGSTDDTPAVLAAFAARDPERIIIERELAPGISRARNRGIARTSGELIVFLDDDAYPEKGYFREALRIGRETEYGFFGGRVLLFDPTAARTSINEGTELRVFDNSSVLLAASLHGCSLIIRRAVFERVGLFDGALGAGRPIPSAEDYEILTRALAAGFTGAFIPSLCVRHDHGRRAGSPEAAAVGEWYDYGRGAVIFDRIRRGDVRYLWYWLRTIRNGLSLSIARRELAGGVRYAVRRRPAARLEPVPPQ